MIREIREKSKRWSGGEEGQLAWDTDLCSLHSRPYPIHITYYCVPECPKAVPEGFFSRRINMLWLCSLVWTHYQGELALVS